MDVTMEWNIICRVCLQEGDMHSLYERDEKNMLICDKIMLCSTLKIQRGQNLPEQICAKCLDELNVAYGFRNNCESSNAVLESFAKGEHVNDLVVCSVKGKIYKYDPPEGLYIKRIRKSEIKQEAGSTVTVHPVVQPKIEVDNDIIIEEDCQESISGESIESQNLQYEITQLYDDLSGNTEVIRAVPSKKKSDTTKTVNSKRQKNTAVRQPRKKVAAGEKPLVVCDICGNSYKQKHSLETHMRRHRNEKPFACEICGRAFVLNVELTCHMRTHTGQKPYACRYCDRRFSDFGSRIKHERSHTGERPYACETCGKAFAYSYGLSSHMLTHTGEKRFECEKCGKRFTKKHHVQNHLNTHLKQENKLRAQKELLEADAIKKCERIDDLLSVLTSEQSVDEYVEEVRMINGNEIEDGDQKPVIYVADG